MSRGSQRDANYKKQLHPVHTTVEWLPRNRFLHGRDDEKLVRKKC